MRSFSITIRSANGSGYCGFATAQWVWLMRREGGGSDEYATIQLGDQKQAHRKIVWCVRWAAAGAQRERGNEDGKGYR
jgi:hypothetical protein